MAFTVDDVQDLIRLLAAHPEWRAELRPLILGDELLDLPAALERLTEAQQRTEQLVGELVQAQQRTEQRAERVEHQIEQLVLAQQRTEQLVGELVQAQQRTGQRLDLVEQQIQQLVLAQQRSEARIDQLSRSIEELRDVVSDLATGQRRLADRLGHVDGRWLEQRFYDRASSYFAHVLLKSRVVELPEIGADQAHGEGRLSEDDMDQLTSLDLIVRGNDRGAGDVDTLIPVEVSVEVREGHINRAVQRGRILERLGFRVIPAVGGERIGAAARRAADDAGVLVRIVRSR